MVTEAFTGEFYQKVDSKARVSIPAAMRRVLDAANPLPGTRSSVFMVYGAGGEYAQCYSGRDLKAMRDTIAKLPNDSRKKMLELAYITRVAEVEIDEDGRLVLPPKVRDRMGVTPDLLAKGFMAAFAAKSDHFQLWVGDAYDAQTADTEFDPDALRELLPAYTG